MLSGGLRCSVAKLVSTQTILVVWLDRAVFSGTVMGNCIKIKGRGDAAIQMASPGQGWKDYRV